MDKEKIEKKLGITIRWEIPDEHQHTSNNTLKEIYIKSNIRHISMKRFLYKVQKNWQSILEALENNKQNNE